MDAAYRKNQTNLLYSGIAIIAFGVWSALKLFFYMGTNRAAVLMNLGFMAGDIESPEIVMNIAAGIIIGFSVLFHLFLGWSAIRDAIGKMRFRLYIPITAIYALGIISSYVNELITHRVDVAYGTLFISFIIDMTSVAALVLILVSSKKLKKIRWEKAEA
ncbi:MAG: hypothetical protein IJH22_04225 [Firmicutes bacterium]|nr:hypothetical protein [Bacillota bacterium]